MNFTEAALISDADAHIEAEYTSDEFWAMASTIREWQTMPAVEWTEWNDEIGEPPF